MNSTGNYCNFDDQITNVGGVSFNRLLNPSDYTETGQTEGTLSANGGDDNVAENSNGTLKHNLYRNYHEIQNKNSEGLLPLRIV